MTVSWLRKRATVYDIDEIPGSRGDWENELTPRYADLPCCDLPLNAEERAMHGSTGVEVTHLIRFPRFRRGTRVEIPDKAKVRIGEQLFNVEVGTQDEQVRVPGYTVKILAKEIRD